MFYYHLEQRNLVSFKINVIFIVQGAHSHPGMQIFNCMLNVILNPDRGVIDVPNFSGFVVSPLKLRVFF